MTHRSKQFRFLVVALLMLGALALGACSSTPLPPLFIMGGSSAPRQAAPAVEVSSMAGAPAPVVSAPAASEVITASAAVAVAAAPTASQAVTETAPLTTTEAITASVRVEEAITATTPITSAVAITAAAAVEPVAVAPTAAPTRAAELAVQPTATRVAPTATRVAPTATRPPARPAATRAPARPTATPTPEWPKTLVITADDIEQGASSVPGLQISGLDVTFGNNAMAMTFDSLRYSFVSMRDVTVEGRFVVNNCDVDFVADRITPRNLATGAIPGFINQSLDQQLGAWCVESLAVQPGQLVATVRPR